MARASSFELVFVGTGEALDPELPNTSVLVRGPQTWLLDCGYAVPHALWRVTEDVDELDAVYLSHFHADHCFGLPALLLRMRLGGRTRPLTLVGGPGSRAKIEAVLELGYPGSFAAHKCYALDFVELEPGAVTACGGFWARCAPTAHSLVNYALRLEAEGMRSLAYSGDGAPTVASRSLFAGVELLVHECFSIGAGERAPASSTKPRRHGELLELLALARDCGVSSLALLHHMAEAKAALRERAQRESPDGLELLLPAPGDRVDLRSG